MRTAEHMTETEQVHRLLPENLMTHLAKGREWATPGVQAALQRAITGLDTGIETASPRLQSLLRLLADELAGGVETLTPMVQERLKRVGPKAAAEAADAQLVGGGRSAARTWWWIGGLLVIVAAGVGIWRASQKATEEPAPTASVPPTTSAPEAGPADPDADADLASGRM